MSKEEKVLLNLTDYNARAWEYYQKKYNQSQRPIPNGIACPKCGAELFDSNPSLTLASWPPQKNIACYVDGCGYKGYRVE